MSAVGVQTLRRNHGLVEWAVFVLQVMIAISFEVGDDLGRGLFSQHGTMQGVQNARQVVSFEAAHGFWIEPAWQLFFLHTRHIFMVTIAWTDVAHVMNGIYVIGHVGLTLGTAAWVYVYRRRFFTLLRNIIMLSNAIALVVYESFPVAPPRLTTGLVYNHHSFVFQDTVFGVMTASGRMVSNGLAYNEFSAMPSVHIAWALVVGGTLFFLSRSLPLRVFGLLYPGLMLVAIVVTGNHFIMDAVGALLVVMLATAISFGAASLAAASDWPLWVRQMVVGER